MKRNELIEKEALTEMMSPSVSPSAARDAEIRERVSKWYCRIFHQRMVFLIL